MSIQKNLKTLCSINSKSKIDGEINIDGINQAQQAYLELFLGLPVELERRSIKGAADLVFIKSKNRSENKPRILLSGHIDTVLTPDEVEFKVDAEKVYGSGVSDMKGGLIVMNEVFKRLNIKNLLDNIDIVVSPEEEIALPNHMGNIREIARNYDYIFVFESTLNSMPDNSLNDRGIVVSRRGYQQYHLKITTPGGHSGAVIEKAKRVNANLLMGHFVTRIDELSDYERRLTFNSGLIQGGRAVNILSPVCELTFDCRFANLDDHLKALESVKSLVSKMQYENPLAKFELLVQDFFPSMDEREEALRFIENFAQTSSFNIHLERRNGGSEASIFAEANPNAIVLDGLGVRGGGEHTTQEYAYLTSFEDAIHFNLELLNLIQQISRK